MLCVPDLVSRYIDLMYRHWQHYVTFSMCANDNNNLKLAVSLYKRLVKTSNR